MRIKGLTCMFRGSRATNTPGPAPLCPKRRPPQPQPPFSMLFTEVVCDLGTLPSRTVTSPPPNGGICTIRGATRRRHAEGRLLMLQNPPPLPEQSQVAAPKSARPGGSSMVAPGIGRAAPMSARARPRRPLTRSWGSHTQARDAEFAGTRRTPPTKTPTFPHQHAEKSLQNQHVLSFNPTVTAGGYWLGYQKPARALRPWPVNLSYMK